MEAKAVWKYARVTPTKARMVANLLRDKDIDEATQIMDVVPRKASWMWKRVVESAVANLKQAKAVEELDNSDVYIKEIYADKAAVWKRWETRSMGRAYRIQKLTSHLTVVVAERQ